MHQNNEKRNELIQRPENQDSCFKASLLLKKILIL